MEEQARVRLRRGTARGLIQGSTQPQDARKALRTLHRRATIRRSMLVSPVVTDEQQNIRSRRRMSEAGEQKEAKEPHGDAKWRIA